MPVPRTCMDVIEGEFKYGLSTEGTEGENTHDWCSDFPSVMSTCCSLTCGWCDLPTVCWEQWEKYWGTLILYSQMFSPKLRPCLLLSSIEKCQNASVSLRLATYGRNEICPWSSNKFVLQHPSECSATEGCEAPVLDREVRAAHLSCFWPCAPCSYPCRAMEMTGQMGRQQVDLCILYMYLLHLTASSPCAAEL